MSKIALGIIISFLACLMALSASAVAHNNTVLVLNLNMEIDPGSASFISTTLTYAKDTGIHNVIIEMNTPGGLLQSMLNIVHSIRQTEQSGIAIYTYVPPGAIAASAGSYIAMATQKIYMAPGTEIGPSTPIVIGGSALQQKHTENAMLALMQSLALAEHRNVTAVSSMVLNNTAYSAEYAAKINVINGVANNMQEMLSNVGLTHVMLDYKNPSTYDKFLSFMSNPVIMGLFITIGTIAILLDIYHASILLSIVGIIFIALGLFGSQLIGASILAIIVFVIAGILIILEFKTGHGFLLVTGASLMVFGTWLLAYKIPYSPTPFGPDQIILMGLMIVLGVIAALYLNWLRVAITKKPKTGWRYLKTRTGTVIRALNPEGEVRINGIIWRGRSVDGKKIDVGKKVKIVDREGLMLILEEIDKDIKDDDNIQS